MKKITVIGLVAALAGNILMTGCVSSARVSWAKPRQAEPVGKTVYLATPVDNRNNAANVVGRHTWTVFALPAGAISSSGADVGMRMTEAVTDALTASGYDVRHASEAPSSSTVVLTPSVDRFHYWSYSWLWPIMFEGGGISLTLRAAPKNGVGPATWERNFEDTAFWMTFFGGYGFDSRIHNNMTTIVNGISRATADRTFAERVAQPTPVASPAPVAVPEPAPSSNAAERLKTLKDLKDSGVLTEEEYEAKRKAALDQL